MQNSATMPPQTVAPRLGPQVPGMSGGLPALSGLAVTQNPVAQELQSYGRGDDSVLVHMTPNEVNSLQGLAMASGGSLTINPHTGLPEAGWLGKLLPTILGFAGAAFGLPTWAIGLGGAAAGTAATGSLSQGLMMGLQAFGGASLAGGLGVGEAGKAAQSLAQNAQADKLLPLADKAGSSAMSSAALQQAASKTPGVLDKFGAFASKGMPSFVAKQAPLIAGAGLLSGVSAATTPNIPKYEPEENKFKYTPMAPGKREVSFQTPEQMRQTGGAEYQYFTPSNPEPVPVSSLPIDEQEQYQFADGGVATAPSQDFSELVEYFGASNPGAITASMYPVSAPMQPPAERTYNFKPEQPAAPTPTPGGGYGDFSGLAGLNLGNLGNLNLSNIDWGSIGRNFSDTNVPTMTPSNPAFDNRRTYDSAVQSLPTPQPNYVQPEMLSIYDGPVSGGNARFEDRSYVQEFARGGGVNMHDGAFVVDARTVSELGNGSSNAGIELLSRMGGHPVRGSGDGVSDSVPASIGGKQEARVARDEVIFQPDAVRRIGGGSEKRGTQKLYSLMNKAHNARKKAKRGQDTNLRKGLA